MRRRQNNTGRAWRGPRVEQWWRRHVTAWRERGVSARVYGEEHGLSVHSLYAWKRKLAERDRERVQRSDTASPQFVAVEVRRDPVPANGICIEIAADGTIRVPAELDPERLAAVLEVARRVAAC